MMQVIERTTGPAVSVRTAMPRTGKLRLVVIGNGMAGARAVEEILARGGAERFEITVFGEEPHGNYNRILLSQVLNGSRDAREIFLHPLSWYEENEVTLHAGERVVAIDREARVVTASSGRRVSYDTLLIATGSRAHVPEIAGLRDVAGAPRPGVFVFRTLDDCRRIAGFAKECRKAAVIGGGLLGLEAARGLIDLGVEVHVVHHGGRLMNQQVDGPAGDLLRGAVEGLGVHVHLHKSTVAVLGDRAIEGLAFDDGMSLACDMVVLACGVRANAELAAHCGLSVERAILVDDQLRSVDDPNVFAVGECAQHRGRVYGLVAPLWEQTLVFADHLTGRKEGAVYAGSRVSTKLKVMGIELASMGTFEPEHPEDEVVQYTEPRRGIYKKLVVRDGALVGAILLGDTSRAPYLSQVFERGTPLPEERAALLFEMGGGTQQLSVEAIPDEGTVCHCNGVSKGDIRECAQGGGCSMHAVQRATRAATGCGSCKPLVQAVIDECARELRRAASSAERRGSA